MVKNLPTMQETWVQSMGQEDPLEKRRATDSSILAWRITWTEEPGGLLSMGLQSVGHDLETKSNTTCCIACVCGWSAYTSCLSLHPKLIID